MRQHIQMNEIQPSIYSSRITSTNSLSEKSFFDLTQTIIHKKNKNRLKRKMVRDK
jgi:hypothetical protein